MNSVEQLHLIDTERVLAFLQGLRAFYLFKGLPTIPEEDASEDWLAMDLFAGGLENRPILKSFIPHVTDPCLSPSQLNSSFSFIRGLVKPEFETETVKQFLALVHGFCKQKNMVLSLTEHNPNHPIERFSKMFMACLLKLHDLIPLALTIVEQVENSPQFPTALADICKLVYDAKLILVKSRQDSSCSYDEICNPAIDRCLFLIDNIRSPITDVLSILHRHQISSMQSRWKNIAKKAVMWQQRNKDQNLILHDCSSHKSEDDSRKTFHFRRHSSRENRSFEHSACEVR